MPEFIQVKTASGHDILINTSIIQAVVPHASGRTCEILGTPRDTVDPILLCTVNHSLDEIRTALGSYESMEVVGQQAGTDWESGNAK
jgi:hypothetical protein